MATNQHNEVSSGFVSMQENLHPKNKMWRELKSAADSRNWTCVDDLLSDVTRCDIEQSCLLHKLAAAPEVSLSLARDILTKILKHKVDINMVDTNNDTAVVVAARCDNTKMVMELLSRQAALPPNVTHVCSFLQTLTNNWKPQETPYMHALVVKLLWDRLQDTALHSCHKQLHHTLVRLAVTFHTSLVREMFVTEQQVNSVDSEGMAVLHRVATFDSEDHVRLLHLLVRKGANINLQNTSGDTPLHIAVKHNNWMMMEALLSRQATTDVADNDHRSVLHILASYTDFECLSELDKILPFLLCNSSDLNKKDEEGNTALHLAAVSGNITFIKKLLYHGARADCVNDQQKTVLHMIGMNSQTFSLQWETCYMLIVKKGADVHKTDSDGNSAIHLAAKHNNWQLVDFLLKHVDDISQPDSDGFNILHRFAMETSNSYKHLFFRLSDKLGDLNSRCRYGDTAVHIAAKNNNWFVVDLLIKQGAIFHEPDSDGFNVLHREAMVENGNCSPPPDNQTDSDRKCNTFLHFTMNSFSYDNKTPAGETALHLAARHANWSMVKCLAEASEDIDEVDSESLTVIQRLVMSSNSCEQFPLFSRLLELGADYTCRDKKGDTVLHLAARNGHWKIVKYLVQLGEETDTPDSDGFLILHRIAQGIQDASILRLLLANNQVLNKRTKHGDTAIHLAAQHKHWQTVTTLIEHGADVFGCDSENTSVLQMMARTSFTHYQLTQIINNIETENRRKVLDTLLCDEVRCGQWKSVLYLVNQEVNIHQDDFQGFNLLHILAKGAGFKDCKGIDFNIVQLISDLLTKGVGLEDKCPNGNTALQLALQCNNQHMITALAQQGANVKGPDSDGVFALQRLAMCKDVDQYTIQLLVNEGADPTICCPNGDSLLHLGARANNWSFVYYIIEETNCADLDKLDSDGYSIMHRLAQSDNGSKWLEKILKKEFPFSDCLSRDGDTSLDELDSDGYSIMHSLAQSDNGSEWLEKNLKKKIIFLDCLSRDGDTCLLLAAKQNNWNFVKHLLEYMIAIKPPSASKVVHDFMLKQYSLKDIAHKMAVYGLLQDEDSKVTSINTRDICGYTIWHHAVKRKLWLVGHLAECGADTDLVDDEGLGVLHALASDSSVDYRKSDYLLKLISKKKHTVTAKDELGNSVLQVTAKKRNLLFIVFLHCFVQTFSKDSDGLPLLHNIVQIIPNDDVSLHENIVNYLLLSGADVNEMSVDNETPLLLAAKCNNWSIVFLLLRHGARANICGLDGLSVNAENCDGDTPLHLAAREGNWQLVMHLIQNGASGRKLDSKGFSILHTFQSWWNQDSCTLNVILSSGIDVDATDPRGNTALHIAAKHRLIGIGRLINKVQNLNSRDSDGLTVLLRLSQTPSEKCLSLCKRLVEKGVDINLRSTDGHSALELAVRSNNWPVVDLLLRNDAHFDVTALEQLYVLHKLTQCSLSTFHVDNQLKLLKLLISRGVSINMLDLNGKTPAELAFSNEKWKLFIHFLHCGAQLNINPRRNSFLHELAKSKTTYHDEEKITPILIYRGLDIGLLNSLGIRPAKVAAFLHKLAKVTGHDEEEISRLQINRRLDIDLLNSFGITPVQVAAFLHKLSKAVYHDVEKTTRLLINRGLDINLQNRVGDTPAHVAADEGNWRIVKTFVEHGADPNTPDRQGNYLVYKFAMLDQADESYFNILKTLVDYGADVNRLGPENKNALRLAYSIGSCEVIGWLIQLGGFCELSDSQKHSSLGNLRLFKWKDVEEQNLNRFINYITNDASDINRTFQISSGEETAFQMCVGNSNWRMAKALIDCGAEVNWVCQGKPLLQFMMSKYSKDKYTTWASFLALLISKQLDINSKLQNGSGVLFHEATIESLGSEDSDNNCLFNSLLELGANPLLVDSNGMTLLRKVVDLGGQRTLNALNKLLPVGVTTHQPRFTKAMIQSPLASPTEKVILDRNVLALKLLIESGSSLNAELFRLNTEYQVKLAGQADTDDNIRELLEVLNMAASEPRSLQSLCRLNVSRCIGCGPDRTDKLNALLPSKMRDLVLFRDLYSDSLSESNSDFNEPEDIFIDGSSSDNGSDELTSSDYSDNESDHSEENFVTA
ncbi:hypothetical protein C0Q70_04762 [Pomacea canaliculata]|uniref:SOCS box domain-containing protein n=1 Tax=Pomacea canaliculata TaxID=400727 RepID=A0A2T7PJ98_POMCA|nr:hypothetical protein C0Q70_04762 [Pomacea canaliculata]